MRLLEEEIGQPKELVFLDLEGTQLSHETIAIGACAYYCDEHLLPAKGKKIRIYKQFVKSEGKVGGVVTVLTGITDSQLKEQGVPFSKALSELVEFSKCPGGKRKYITFGNQDLNMLRVSTFKDDSGKAKQFYYHIKKNWFDLQEFVSRYVHDARHITYSQPKLLEIFEAENLKHAHDPLYDAENLKNLFIQVLTRPDIMVREFEKGMFTGKEVGNVLKPVLVDLSGGRDVTAQKFRSYLEAYFS